MFQISGFYLADSLNAIAEPVVGRCVTTMSKWLHNCFYIFDSHICNSRNLYCFTLIFQSVYVIVFFSVQSFYISAILQLVYLYGYSFSKGKDHIRTLNTMIVKYPCLVCKRAVAKNHKIKQSSVIVVIGGLIIGISESRLQINEQPINNISLPNYVYEHIPTEFGKRGMLLYIDQNLKYKARR